MPEVVWQACPATRLEVPGRPAAVLHKAADFSHRTEADSEGCPSHLTDGVRALHFAPTHTTDTLSEKGAETVVSSACAKRRLPERGWNLDAANTKERKVRSPQTGLEAGGP